jgi:hypothetical protein
MPLFTLLSGISFSVNTKLPGAWHCRTHARYPKVIWVPMTNNFFLGMEIVFYLREKSHAGPKGREVGKIDNTQYDK